MAQKRTANTSTPSHMSFPWKTVWKPKVPTKFLPLDWILTNDNLRKCQLVVIDWCCMCKRAWETYNYLLLHCCVAKSCGAWCLHFLGFVELCPAGVIELLASWTGKFSRHRNGVIWNMIPHCLIWSIWWERNTWIFQGTGRSNHELKLFSF